MTDSSFFATLIAELERTGPQPAPWAHMTTEWLVHHYPHLADVEVGDVPVVGPRGPVPARLYRAPEASGRAFVWVHGGAFIAGDLEMPEAHWVSLELAARGIPVLSVDYTKALNGVKHPVLSDEILAAWSAATANAREWFGVDADDVHLGGASAGANLTAGVTLRLRGGAAQVPASLTLVYPLVHPELPEASEAVSAAVATLPPEARFAPDGIRYVNLNYVGTDEGLRDPIAFPGLAALEGHPPVRIIVAERDDLRPSGELYADQLAAAGVPVEFSVETDALHGHLNEPGSQPALRSLDRMATWLVRGPASAHDARAAQAS
jgi:acetyl esterase